MATLLTADGDEGDRLGGRVAMSTDTAIVGADHDADNGEESGSAYVFDLASLVPDLDGDVDLDDYAVFAAHLTGPAGGVRTICTAANLDCDDDIDLADFTRFQVTVP